jgi:hypothetical protein
MAKQAARIALCAGVLGITLAFGPAVAGGGESPAAQAAAVKQLMIRDLAGPIRMQADGADLEEATALREAIGRP